MHQSRKTGSGGLSKWWQVQTGRRRSRSRSRFVIVATVTPPVLTVAPPVLCSVPLCSLCHHLYCALYHYAHCATTCAVLTVPLPVLCSLCHYLCCALYHYARCHYLCCANFTSCATSRATVLSPVLCDCVIRRDKRNECIQKRSQQWSSPK